MAAALPECYHGPMSKKECEELLGRKNKDGAYLIRESESIQGALCLCVYKQKVIYTYRILQAHNGSYTLLTSGGVEETYFKSLEDLVRNYKRKNQGLAIHLRHAVKKKTAMLIQRPSKRETPPNIQAGLPSGVSAGVPSVPPPRVAPRVSAGRTAQRGHIPLLEDDPDYENNPSSEYVEVLPDV
ncbi:SH2 domain-containing protein 1B [Kryptolebias marmoratus]|uniref:Si:ch73-264p11.1 n=1 Tax=Kryptolebias marmoratus TaxID=37003 RepID=A0A3Q3AHL4_KRYMA|nr:SH2 domain-containing protein 1B [Kryptolebias marmoratus]